MKLKNKKILLLIPVVIFIVLTVITTSYSKYIHNSIRSYYLKSKGFYFASESLSPNTQKNTNLSWDGTNISFTIKNSISDEEITTFDIPYKVTCEVIGNSNQTCNLYNTGTNTYNGTLSGSSRCVNNTEDGVDVTSLNKTNCELKGYIWTREKSQKELYFNIESQDSISDVEVKITVESLNKYKQKLIGIYKLYKKNLVSKEVITNYENYSNYDKLTITNTTDTKKCLSMSFDSSKLRIDNSINLKSYNPDSNNYINELEIEINNEERKELYFYKVDLNTNYTLDNLNIEECS